MKTLTFFALILSTLFSICNASENELIDKYYEGFQVIDGTASITIFSNFSQEAPENEKAEILANIIDRAIQANNNIVIRHAIVFLNGSDFGGRQIKWSEHLSSSLNSQAKNQDPVVRKLLVGLLGKAGENETRELVLSFQNDPDEKVRSAFIRGIVDWPDAKTIYQKYIEDHQADPNYAESVQYARNWLNIVNERAKSPSSTVPVSEAASTLAPTLAPKPVPTPTPAAQVVVTETTPPLWLYAIIILSAAFLIGSWYFLRSKK